MGSPEQFVSSYSVPFESRAILLESLVSNNLHSSLPAEAKEFAHHVRFEGSSLPCLPINWRLAESAASLKALEAVLINVLISRKYGQGPFPVTIDTDHAQLFFMSSLLIEANPDPASPVQPTPIRELTEKYSHFFPNRDLHQMSSSPFRKAVTNI
ncbi:acyl transferase carnitine dehydratase, partial [Fusarium pseudoanthophilum]